MRLSYRSTRGQTPPVSFADALLQGLAPDGGLFIPTHIPAIPEADWRGAERFPEMAARLLGHWLADDVPTPALAALAAEAFDFPVPLVPLHGGDWGGLHVLELFHGPTLSFKDFGARTMARLMSHFLKDRDQTLTILVATSGDTGSAVADGFAGLDGISVVLLYPKGQVSPTQERQLIVRRPGVRTFAVEGTFDDCQRMVKAAFMDATLADLGLSSANSINIGRLLPQMLYYFWAMNVGGFASAEVVVPSGNLGNLTAGVLAARSGLPIGRFLAAHNANDFFPRFLAEGATDFPPSVRTLSNAMDVGVPSNFERLRALLDADRLRNWIAGARLSDTETLAAMRRIFDETGYLADPHTAVGLEAARRFRTEGVPLVVLSTAHPAKFPEVATRALGRTADTPARLARLWEAPTAVTPLAPTHAAFREALRAV